MLTKHEETFDLQPRNFEEAMKFAKLIADSDLAPKDFKGKPGNVMVAIQMGRELGLKPMQAIQNIAVINGRGSVWGDAMLAIVIAHSDCEYVHEKLEGTEAICAAKRRNQPEVVRKFSLADATEAGLIEKPGPWKQYRNRMLQMRARAFCLRDAFPDVLKGVAMREEVEDYPEPKDITPSKKVQDIKNLVNKEVESAAPVIEQGTISEESETTTDVVSESPSGEINYFDFCKNLHLEASNFEELNAAREKSKEFKFSEEQQQELRKLFISRGKEISTAAKKK